MAFGVLEMKKNEGGDEACRGVEVERLGGKEVPQRLEVGGYRSVE